MIKQDCSILESSLPHCGNVDTKVANFSSIATVKLKEYNKRRNWTIASPTFCQEASLAEKKKLAASTFNNRLSKVCNLKTNMDQLVRLLCSCIKDKVMEDADGDGVPDFMQKSKTNFNAFF